MNRVTCTFVALLVRATDEERVVLPQERHLLVDRLMAHRDLVLPSEVPCLQPLYGRVPSCGGGV